MTMNNKNIKNILYIIKDWTFNFIFCFFSKKIKRQVFQFYGSHTALSKLTPDLKNLRITDDNGNPINISLSSNDRIFSKRLPNGKWKSPVEYPLKIDTKSSPYFNKTIEPYNEKLNLNYGKHYNKKGIAQDLTFDIELVENCSNDMAMYAARKSAIKPFKKNLIKLQNTQNINSDNKCYIKEVIIQKPNKQYTKIPDVVYTSKGPMRKSEILGYEKNGRFDAIRKHSNLWKWDYKNTFMDDEDNFFKYYANKSFKDYDLYDLEEEMLPEYLLTSEDFGSWFEVWNPMGSYLTDQYLFTIPLVFIFYHIHWTLAEAIICKFKCQQHYWINSFLLNGWFLLFIYFYKFYNLPDSNKTQCFYGAFFDTPDWPLYFILYQWWFFLILSFFIVSIFLIFAPKSPYLRSKNIMSIKDYSVIFLPCVIGLLMPPIFAQKRLPFWNKVETMLLYNSNKIQYHPGYIYMIVIFLLIAFISVLFFYIAVSLKYFFFYKLTNNPIYLDDNIRYLFHKLEDDRDVYEDTKTKAVGLPTSLVCYTEDFSSETYKIPDGYFFHFSDPYNYKLLWTGSISRYVFLIWYFLIWIYCSAVGWFYSSFQLPTVLFFVLFSSIFLTFLYSYYCIKILEIDVNWKNKHKLAIYLLIFISFIFFYIFFKDFLFFINII